MPSGSCWCGNLQYEFSGEPIMKATCHCLACRKVTGSAFSLNALLPKAAVKVTSGTFKTFTKAHENGMLLTITFCPECATTIYKEADDVAFEDKVILQIGTLDGALDSLGPEAELWVQHRPGWLPEFAGAVQKQEF
ncbi:hypothetical protein V500_08886 [Pseudogymnoascus sp. VKM F-4518 (FW-2643)]|nr:hypothetical protein V500_08886 [Pseudogymnoascus sp. VKM F-4518 (FW-2643)]